MSLKRIVEPLIEDPQSTSRYLRAIKLFEFQIALLHPGSFRRLVASESDVTAPTRTLKTARIFAASKILEKIEADLKREKDVPVISIREVATDENCRSMFDDVLAPNGSWLRIRRSMSESEFDGNIEARSEQAQDAANVVDFSYRFSIRPLITPHDRRANPGGVSAARYVVRRASSYGSRMSRRKIRYRWKEYQLPAIFLYLMLNQKFDDLKPPPICSTKFCERLLEQTDNVERLRRFFRAYQIVRDALVALKYKCYPALDLDLESSPAQLDAPEFSQDIQREFKKWLEDDDDD